MGDAENVFPPSKKRVAGRELSRDNPGLDDDDDASEQETGTFKRASEEVLSTRRIVKVRRHQPPSTASSNPFVGISLVTPTDVSAKVTTSANQSHPTNDKSVPKEADSSAVEGEAEDQQTEEEPATDEPNGTNLSDKQVEKETIGPAVEVVDTEKKESVEEVTKPTEGDRKAASGEGTKDKTEEEDNGHRSTAGKTASLSSFQQLSSSQNAFMGLAGTGFSSSSFSFGSIPEGGSGPLFGLKSDNSSFPSFGIGNSNSGSLSLQLFGSGASDPNKREGIGLPSMQEVPIETGEENEKAVFTADAVLFEYLDGGWKERGKGELKVNVSTKGPERARLVMRARGNYRLILNANLYPDMKLANMDKRGITFACMNSAGEGKEGLATFALKFKDASIVDEFRGAIMAHKGEKTAVLKTPENSPKASDD